MAATGSSANRSDTPEKKRERASAFSLLLLFGLLIGLYFVFQYVEQLSTLVGIQRQIAKTEQYILEEKQSNLDLEAEYEYAASDVYAATVARSELGYIQDGDDVFVLLPSASQEESTSSTTPEIAEEERSGSAVHQAWWKSLLIWNRATD